HVMRREALADLVAQHGPRRRDGGIVGSIRRRVGVLRGGGRGHEGERAEAANDESYGTAVHGRPPGSAVTACRTAGQAACAALSRADPTPSIHPRDDPPAHRRHRPRWNPVAVGGGNPTARNAGSASGDVARKLVRAELSFRWTVTALLRMRLRDRSSVSAAIADQGRAVPGCCASHLAPRIWWAGPARGCAGRE